MKNICSNFFWHLDCTHNLGYITHKSLAQLHDKNIFIDQKLPLSERFTVNSTLFIFAEKTSGLYIRVQIVVILKSVKQILRIFFQYCFLYHSMEMI